MIALDGSLTDQQHQADPRVFVSELRKGHRLATDGESFTVEAVEQASKTGDLVRVHLRRADGTLTWRDWRTTRLVVVV